jgi:hypothetical protein
MDLLLDPFDLLIIHLFPVTQLPLLISHRLRDLLHPRLQEGDHDLILIDVPPEVIVDVLALLKLLLDIGPHLLSYLLIVSGRLGLVSLVPLLQ